MREPQVVNLERAQQAVTLQPERGALLRLLVDSLDAPSVDPWPSWGPQLPASWGLMLKQPGVAEYAHAVRTYLVPARTERQVQPIPLAWKLPGLDWVIPYEAVPMGVLCETTNRVPLGSYVLVMEGPGMETLRRSIRITQSGQEFYFKPVRR